MILGRRKRIGAVAPDMTDLTGLTGLDFARRQAAQCCELIRHDGVDLTQRPVYGGGRLPESAGFALSGYRAVSGEQTLTDAVGAWISAGVNAGGASVFSVGQHGRSVSCCYSSSVPSVLEKAIPDAVIGSMVQPCKLPYSAVVVGVPKTRLDYDAVIDASQGGTFAIQAVCLPPASIAEKLDQVAAMRSSFGASAEMTVPGIGGRAQAEVAEVAELMRLCDEVREDLLSHPDRTMLVFIVGAESEALLQMAAGMIMGCCAPSQGSACKPPQSCRWESHPGTVPVTDSGAPVAYDMPVVTAVLACMPPSHSHRGFAVSQSAAASDRRAFPGVGRDCDATAYQLGLCANDGSQVAVGLHQMHSAFICGDPGTGKTNLLLGLVRTASDNHVPTLVIEASSKKEFAGRLLRCARNFEVLGVGPARANMPLRFNPMAVPSGTQVAKHAEDFAAAMLRAADDDPEAPLPQAVEAVVKNAYRAAGWGLGDIAYEDASRPWPTIAGLSPAAYLGSSMYEARVKGNIEQAIITRVGRLMTYSDMLCSSRALGLKKLTEGNAVLELGDMGERSAAFLTTCILQSLFEYAMQLPVLPHGADPRLMVVVDEVNALLSCEGPNRPVTALIERAFREFRSKGIAFVVAGQRVEGVEGVIANAALKVAFRCDWRGDIEAISGSFGLEPYQERLVGTLPDLEAIAKLPGGGSEAVPVRMDLFDGEASTALEAACATCGVRVFCDRCMPEAQRALGRIPDSTVRDLREGLIGSGYDPMRIAAAKSVFAQAAGAVRPETAHCMVGLALQRSGVGFELARRAFMDAGR